MVQLLKQLILKFHANYITNITKATRQYTYTLLQVNANIQTKTCCLKNKETLSKSLQFRLLKPQEDNV